MDWIEEAEARCVELEQAIAAARTAHAQGDTAGVRMHACMAQMAADHCSWAIEDWFTLDGDDSAEFVAELRALRRRFDDAVTAIRLAGAE